MVEFVGYHVGWESYRPADDMIAAIKNFPIPVEPSISDVRAWFGLINQVAPFVAKAPNETYQVNRKESVT